MKGLKKFLMQVLACLCMATAVTGLASCKGGFSFGCGGDNSSESSVSSPEEHTHVWNDGEITTPATCETDGEKTYSCECGETRKETISAMGHDYANNRCQDCRQKQTQTPSSQDSPSSPTAHERRRQ